ncbi:hypothetical protein OL383_004439 [Salmonella enterica]|nr:hypothetical protein [Salmonella enterica]
MSFEVRQVHAVIKSQFINTYANLVGADVIRAEHDLFTDAVNAMTVTEVADSVYHIAGNGDRVVELKLDADSSIDSEHNAFAVDAISYELIAHWYLAPALVNNLSSMRALLVLSRIMPNIDDYESPDSFNQN